MDSCYTYISASLHYVKVSTLVKGTKKCIDLTILSFYLLFNIFCFLPNRDLVLCIVRDSVGIGCMGWGGVGGGGGASQSWSCGGNIFAIISNNFNIAVSIRVVTLFHDIFATTKYVFNENVLLQEFFAKARNKHFVPTLNKYPKGDFFSESGPGIKLFFFYTESSNLAQVYLYTLSHSDAPKKSPLL